MCSLALAHHAESVLEMDSDAREGQILQRVYGVILLSGIFDIPKQFQHECTRGVEEVSCTQRLMGPGRQEMLNYSPGHIFRRTMHAAEDFKSELPVHWLLIHGNNDKIVPYSSSILFANTLALAQIDGFQYHPTYDTHNSLLFDMMLPDGCIFAKELDKFYRRALKIDRFRIYQKIESKRELTFDEEYEFYYTFGQRQAAR